MNRKGFLLAESIIVAVFILGMFTFLALNIFPLIIKYDNTLNYDNPNEIYLINSLYNEMKNEGLAIPLSGVNYCLTSSINNCTYLNGSDYIKKLISNMDIEIILIYNVEIDSSNINTLDRGIRTYYNYQHARMSADPSKSNGSFMLVKFSNNKYASVMIG